MEAACMKNNGNVTGKAAEYWRAVRIRAGVDPDFTKTIAATDLSKENDLAKYKGENEMIDVTLSISVENVVANSLAKACVWMT